MCCCGALIKVVALVVGYNALSIYKDLEAVLRAYPLGNLDGASQRLMERPGRRKLRRKSEKMSMLLTDPYAGNVS